MNLKEHGCKPHKYFSMEMKPANPYKHLSSICISNKRNAWSQLFFTVCLSVCVDKDPFRVEIQTVTSRIRVIPQHEYDYAQP
jgi:hypothetical protein